MAATEALPSTLLLLPYRWLRPLSRGRKPSYVIIAQTGATGGPYFPWPLPAKILVLSQLLCPLHGICGLVPSPLHPPTQAETECAQHPRAVLTERSGVSTEGPHEQDWSLAILSPRWQTLDGLRRLWNLKLADLGSAPFIKVVGASLNITDTYT